MLFCLFFAVTKKTFLLKEKIYIMFKFKHTLKTYLTVNKSLTSHPIHTQILLLALILQLF